MKILLIHYRYFISGGPERYLFNVKKAFEDRGHTVIPFSISNINNEKSDYEKFFVENIANSNEVFVNKYPKKLKTYIDLIDREFYSNKVARKLKKLIEAEKPNICYLLVYKRALSPSVIDVCKKFEIPVINRISDYNTVCGAGSLYRNKNYCELCLNNEFECVKNKCIKGKYIYSLMRFLSNKLHKKMKINEKIDTFICTNNYMAEMMLRYGYDRNKIEVVPTFFKENDETINWDKTNIIDEKLINFLFIGNVDESKGIYDLLEAIALLKEKKVNFHLYIVGGLQLEENQKVKQMIVANDIEQYITFIPFMKNGKVFEYYLKCNITILPARWVENLPNTLIESIYFNRPVIVPNFGSFKYTVDNSVSFKYDALSSYSLYQSMLELCENPKQIDEKSKNCSAFFERNFSEEMHIKKLVGLMNELIEKNKERL